MFGIGLEFEWEVPQEGLRWVDRGQEEGSGSTFTLGMVLGKEVDARPPWLIGPPVGGKVPTTSRHPLEEFPGLHREFAELPIQRKAVLEFAQRYGPLTKGLVLVEERGERHLAMYRAEPWHFWLREIQDMYVFSVHPLGGLSHRGRPLKRQGKFPLLGQQHLP